MLSGSTAPGRTSFRAASLRQPPHSGTDQSVSQKLWQASQQAANSSRRFTEARGKTPHPRVRFTESFYSGRLYRPVSPSGRWPAPALLILFT